MYLKKLISNYVFLWKKVSKMFCTDKSMKIKLDFFLKSQKQEHKQKNATFLLCRAVVSQLFPTHITHKLFSEAYKTDCHLKCWMVHSLLEIHKETAHFR